MYKILGNSSLVKARNGYDLSSFSIELYLGRCCLISCLSRISASCGEFVTIHSISSEFLTTRESSHGLDLLQNMSEFFVIILWLCQRRELFLRSSKKIDSGLCRQIDLVKSHRHVCFVATFHQEYIAIMGGEETSLMSDNQPIW